MGGFDSVEATGIVQESVDGLQWGVHRVNMAEVVRAAVSVRIET